MIALLSSSALFLICSLTSSADAADQINLLEAKIVAGKAALVYGTDFIQTTCFVDSDCGEAQKCVARKQDEPGMEQCSSMESVCGCLIVIPCNSTADCGTGQVCSQELDVNTCIREERTSPGVDRQAASDMGSFIQASVRKFNLEQCSQSDECTGPRTCVVRQDGNSAPCDGTDSCVCLSQRVACTSTSDCEDGDRCRGVRLSFSCVSARLPGFQQNLEPCLSSEDCRGQRECVAAAGGTFIRCLSGVGCRCLTTLLVACTTSDECDTRETCQRLSATVNFCVSEELDIGPEIPGPSTTTLSPSTEVLDFDLSPSPIALESTQTPSPSAGVAPPVNQPNSPGPSASSSTVIEPGPSNSAEPLPTSLGVCNDDSDCDSSEECSNDENDSRRCVRREADICISVHHLTHLGYGNLIYSTHRLARVLCDEQNSCATAGHIVMYKTSPMMMISYCSVVSCTQKIMHVNSPRYKRGTLVRSNSNGLMFTGLAARYNSVVEEKVLGIAIRMGF